MERSLLSLMTGTVMLVGVGVAQAGDVTPLTDSQMDSITAGAALWTFGNGTRLSMASGGNTTSSVSFFNVPTSTGPSSAAGVAMGCPPCTVNLTP